MEKTKKVGKLVTKYVLKPFAYFAGTMLIASPIISFDLQQAYHEHDYKKDGVSKVKFPEAERKKLKVELNAKGLGPLTEKIFTEIEKPRVYLYGNASPDEIRLEISGGENNFRITYWCHWDKQRGEQKKDWEPVTATYSVDRNTTLKLESISYRPHNEVGTYYATECSKLNTDFYANITITLGTYVHTPGIPGCHPKIATWGASKFNWKQSFTEYARVDTNGAAIKRGEGTWALWPPVMHPVEMNLTVGSAPEEAKRNPYF